MEEKVLNIINGHNKALTYEEIMAKLDEDEVTLLPEVLSKLIKDLKVRLTNKGKYAKFDDKSQKIGVFAGNKKGFGFVIVDGEGKDYHISSANVGGAIDGDEVVIKVLDESKHEAAVLRVNKRNLSNLLVGEFCRKDNKNFLKLDDDKLNIIVEILDEDASSAVPGHKVVVKVLEGVEKSNYYYGQVVRILGHKDDPGVDILSVAARYKINDIFPENVLEELKSIPSEVQKEDLVGRVDLTNEVIFTIDGDDTKDIDDAISIKRLDNGNYELGVHIADVSHYVKEGTALGDEAYARGTSSYLANTVIPMLPHQLSNGICSLNPDVVRLTISCVMEIDSKGQVISSDIFESYIRSNKQMTYKNVNKILNEKVIPEGYEEFVDDLKLMEELSKIIRKSKLEKGYIDFDVPEPKIITDAEGRAIDIQRRVQDTGENLIEDFMVIANETVATTIAYIELPFIYRVHGLPDVEKVQNFMHFVSVLGYKVQGNIKNITPKVIQNILHQLEDKKEYHILSSMLLRSMQKAVYDSVNIGHFGLASKFYTHFTSPIRRFPDLTVHRLLRTYLFKHNINNEVIDYYTNTLPEVAKHSSEREMAATQCERDVDDMKMAEYMEGHIGEVYKGVISTVTNYGVYVELSNLVEGMIKVDDLDDDYYFYDESTFSLVGKRSKKRYMLGQTISIVVDSTDKEKGLVNFKVYKKGDASGNTKQKSEA